MQKIIKKFNYSKFLVISILFIIFLFSGCTTKENSLKPLTVKSLKETYKKVDRIENIAYSILISNKKICSKKHSNYGLVAAALNPKATATNRKIWSEAFNVKNRPTIIRIISHSIADTAGLRVGDEIVSVNDMIVSSETSEQGNFYDFLKAPSIKITVLRNTKRLSFDMTAERTCDVQMILSLDEGINAFAKDNKIVVGSELEKLLQNDDELALVITHELAHIILGHTLIERQNEIETKQMRAVMEKDADALGMQMFLNAGYNPEVGLNALKKMDCYNRGPISRWLGLYGAYMPTKDRIRYLKSFVPKRIKDKNGY